MAAPTGSGPPPPVRMPRSELDALLGFEVSDEQWLCVSAPLEPFVIVAGAGTGKTAVMAARVLWLVASGLVREHEVLGLTFTNKAASELAARVTLLLNRWRAQRPADRETTNGEPTIATYHSFARRLIDEQGLRVGIEPGARLLSAAAVAQLAFRVVCQARDLTATRHGPSQVASHVIRLDANLAEQAISTDDLRAHDQGVIAAVDAQPKPTKAVLGTRETALRRTELAKLVDELRRARQAVGGLDFSDHMRLCADLVRSSEELVAGMRAAYPVVLLDEYQDTSIAQRVILSTLFGGTGVTAVGDPMQAIYGWRSASVANIDSFAQHFGRAGHAPTRVLSLNRRSGTPILAVANAVAADLRAAHPQVEQLRAPQPRRAEVRAALLPTVADEQHWITDQVAQLVSGGTGPEDIAILGRTNDQLAPLQRMLVARGIPASISGTAALTASPYAMAVLSTLRVLADPADNTAVASLIMGPRWRIGPADLEALGSRARILGGAAGAHASGGGGAAGAHAAGTRAQGAAVAPGQPVGADHLRRTLREASEVLDPVEQVSLLEASGDPGPGVSAEAAARLEQFLGELRVLQASVGAPLADLVDQVVAVTGARVEADLANGAQAVGDVGLAGLLNLVEGFNDAEGRTGLAAFLAYLDAAEELDAEEDVDLPTSPDSVQLMTMHKAKGLEFPVVILPHLCRGAFPGGRASERWTSQAHVVPSQLRDDRHVLPALRGYTSKDHNAFVEDCREHDRSGDDRLAYVGITRAEQVLITSGHWWGATQKNARGPSAYLEALREHATSPDRDPWEAEPQTEAAPDVAGAAEAEHQSAAAAESGVHADAGPAARVDAESGVHSDGEPAPDRDETGNPMLELVEEVQWPIRDDPDHPDGVVSAARLVSALIDAGAAGGRYEPSASSDAPEPSDTVARTVAAWDTAILALLARTERGPDAGAAATLPSVLTASATMDLAADPGGFAEQLVRPMPRRRNRHAELGTAFHAWVEARLGVQPLITDDDLPGAADDSVAAPDELEELKAAFEALDYARRTPSGLEVPFTLLVGGRQIRGRIDAVFPAMDSSRTRPRWEVVDWKTSARDEADPLQLAIYRAAWADLMQVPTEDVDAAFVFVRSGTVLRPSDLPDEAALADLLAGGRGDDPGSR